MVFNLVSWQDLERKSAEKSKKKPSMTTHCAIWLKKYNIINAPNPPAYNPLLITYIQNLLSYGITFLYFTYDQKILFLFY